MAASLCGLLVAQRFGSLSRLFGRESLAARLVGLFHVPASAAKVGRAYLRVAPLEADETRLLQLIGAAHPAWQAADAARLRRLITRRQVEDFRRGRVVSVQGWTLSSTEARLCALAALREGAWSGNG